MSAVDLEPAEAQYLSVLLARDIRDDEACGMVSTPARHRLIWEKLQPACEWDDDVPTPP